MRLNLLTFNMHKGLSPLNRHFTLPKLRDALGQLSPDVIFLQEVQGKNDVRAQQFAHWPLIPHHEFLAGGQFYGAYASNRHYASGHHGNAILSRFPIVHVHNQNVTDFSFEARGLLHAKIALMDGRFLYCVCVHLSLFQQSRKKQMKQLVESLNALFDSAENHALIIAGDFNDWQNDARHYLVEALHCTEIFEHQKGKIAKSFPTIFPLFRLDRIYVKNCTILESSVLNHAEWKKISDHLALSASIEF